MAWKPDQVTATMQTSNEFAPHPDGQFVARCVDVVDLGEKLDQFQGKPEKVTRKALLVFMTGELKDNGEPHLVTREMTVSAFPASNLRQFLEAWRGKGYDDADLMENGLPLHKLVGQYALINITHETSKAGRTYGKLNGIMPVMKGLAKPPHLGEDYERPAWITDKKNAYAAEVAQYKRRIGADKPKQTQPAPGFDAPPPPEPQEDDSLPF